MKIESGSFAPLSVEKAASSKPGASRELTAALEDFEAMFAATLLRTAREENGKSWLGGESSPGGDGIMDFAEQNIAKAMAKQGAFGIAKTLSKSLTR